MTKVREKALKLRLSGYSYNEINKKLGIPKSTLSGWFSDLILSKKSQERLNKRKTLGTKTLIRRNKKQTHDAWKRAVEIRRKSKEKISKITKRDLFILGISLYWAEGHKKLAVKNGKEITSHAISFTNSDPEMIRIFVIFLKSFFPGISNRDITVGVRIFKHMNEKQVLSFWRKVTELPSECFSKCLCVVSKSSQRKRPFNRLPYGTVQIRVNSTDKFHELMGWVEGIKKKAIM